MHAYALLRVPARRIDDVSLLIWSLPGTRGIEELPVGGGTLFAVDPDFAVVEYGTDAAQRFAQWIDADSYRQGSSLLLRVYLEVADQRTLESWVEEFRHEHPTLPILQSGPVPERNYVAAYRSHCRGQEIGQRFWVGPPWEKPAPGRLPIIIEPGAAFGTGDHPSTILCLESLERVAGESQPIRRIFDVGTGSGVLAIAAARLFPDAELWLSDLDAGCAGNCQGNFARNGLADLPRHEFWGTAAELRNTAAPAAAFDLVLANIYTGVLEALVDPVAQLLRPGGRWVVSGLLQGEQATAFRHQAESKFTCRRVTSRPCASARQEAGAEPPSRPDVWVAVELVRRGAGCRGGNDFEDEDERVTQARSSVARSGANKVIPKDL